MKRVVKMMLVLECGHSVEAKERSSLIRCRRARCPTCEPDLKAKSSARAIAPEIEAREAMLVVGARVKFPSEDNAMGKIVARRRDGGVEVIDVFWDDADGMQRDIPVEEAAWAFDVVEESRALVQTDGQ